MDMSEQTVVKPYYKEIDILRGLAILMVLCYHSILVYPINLHEMAWCRELHSYLWVVEMPLFFLVSGFCFQYGSPEKTGAAKTYGTYLWKKTKRVLVPHVVFGLLDIGMRVLPTGLVNKTDDAGTLIYEFLFFGGSDWFLWTLFVMFLIFPLFHWLFRTGTLGKEIVILAVCLLYFLRGFLPGIFLLSTLAEFLPYFFIGYLIRQSGAYEAVRKNLANWGVTVVAILASVLFFMMYMQLENGLPLFGVEIPVLDQYNDRIQDLLQMLVALNGALICFKLAELILKGPNPSIQYLESDGTALVKKSQNRVHGFFMDCSHYSLQLYLLDGYALVVTRTILVSVLGVTNPWILILGNFILDTAICLVLSKLVIDKVKLFRLLCGLN